MSTNNKSDFDFLSPTEARQKLRQMYRDARIESSIPKKRLAEKRSLWAKDPFQFMADVLPHRFKRERGKPAPFGEFHKDMWDSTEHYWSKPVLVCGFRGSAKTSVLNFGRHIYDICHNKVNYALIGSFNEYKAKRLILPLLLELEENPIIKAAFGNLTDNRIWSPKSFVTKNNIRYEALGIAQSSMGSLHNNFRPDVVCLDDIMTTESARSVPQSEALLFWFWSDILPAMRPEIDGGFRAWVCATMVSTFSPIYKMFYNEEYEGKVIKRLYNIWKDDGTLQWPERYTEKEVQKLEKNTPAFTWHGERQMPPLEATELLFNPEDYRYYQEEDLQGRDLHTLAFCDPASRTGKKNDFSALVVLSLDLRNGEMFVRRGSIYKRISEDDIVKQCYYIDTLYRNITFVFEGNGFQRLFKYVFSLHRELKGYAPKVETIDRVSNKYLRMSGLNPYLTSHMLYFLEGDPQQTDGLNDMKRVSQVERRGLHDDWPDSLIGAIDAIQELRRGMGLSAGAANHTDFTRTLKTPDRVLAHSQHHRDGLLSNPSMTPSVLNQMFSQQIKDEYRESVMERRVKRKLESLKTVPCARHEFLDVRSYLFKFREKYDKENQPEKLAFVDEEIQRLDKRFSETLHQ